MAITVYPKAKKKFQDGDIDLLVDTIVAILVKSTGSYNASHEFLSDIGANEMNAAGYARQTVGTKTTTIVGTDSIFDAADVVFPAMAAGTSAIACVLAKNTGADATSAIFCWYDGGTPPNDLPKTTNGGTLTVQWNASGILKFA